MQDSHGIAKRLLKPHSTLISLCSGPRGIWSTVLVTVALGKSECQMQLGYFPFSRIITLLLLQLNSQGALVDCSVYVGVE